MAEKLIGDLVKGGGLQHFWLPKGSPQIPRIERAEGMYVWDQAGRSYMDCTSGPVVVNVGHANPRVLAAMREQAEKVCYAYPSGFENEANTELSNLLTDQAGEGFDRAFFVSSGSEAMEKCLEFARLHALAVGQGDRYKLISRHPSYHGSTLGAMGLNGDSLNTAMTPMLRPSIKIPAPLSYRYPDGFDRDSYALHCAQCLDQAIQQAGPETVLAYIMEPVMGLTGGAQYAPDFYYTMVREICDRHGVLLIYDEVISGAGRTGRFMASHWWPTGRPDLMTFAKGIGGGYYPLGGFLAPDHMVEEVVRAGGFHLGHTYKASPLGCAVGLAVLQELIDQDLMHRARVEGQYLRDRLNVLKSSLVILGDVRGIGQLNAIELVADQTSKTRFPATLDVQGELKKLGMAEGLLIYARRSSGGEFGDWLMMTPPLIATRNDIDVLVERLEKVLRAFQDKLTARGFLV
ncbi:MAG: aminotransferase class III-fold pyridoxal phosphate-dependent enzyme [Gammaproteobacteria bacterium]|nr:aminotransferase class III-fold pyridoxal phosphate-dependent enzyme [Gammaproteobacteria bacterium]